MLSSHQYGAPHQCIFDLMQVVSELTNISDVFYSEMEDGSWAVVLQSPEHDFVVQREFNLTVGGSATTVVVTVSRTISG